MHSILLFFYIEGGIIMFKKYKTINNKIYALVMVSLGAALMWLDGDATVLVLFLMIGVPLFFAKENWIY